MDKTLERAALLASVGSFLIALLSVPWFVQILGLVPARPNVPGLEIPVFDISALPFAFRITAAFLLAFAYCWLFSFLSVFFVAMKNSAAMILAAIVTFFTCVVVLTTINTIGFNLSAEPGHLAGDLPEPQRIVLLVCGALGWLTYVLCAGHHWFRSAELAGKDLGFPSVIVSLLVYGAAAYSLKF